MPLVESVQQITKDVKDKLVGTAKEKGFAETRDDVKFAAKPFKPTDMHQHPKRKENEPPMKAVAWYGKQDMRMVDVQRPTITDPDDVVLKVTSTCICGSDLHLYLGYITGMQKGDIVGHEFMGIVEEVGPNVTKLQKGDRVVTCFDIGCGACNYCKHGMWSSCDTTNPSPTQESMYGHRTAGFFGYSHLLGAYDGGQADYVRVPLAEHNTLKVPEGVDDDKVILLSDILPTAWHANEMGEVSDGKTVAIWGAGPVGQLAAYCAFHRGASRVVIIDSEQYRLDYAQRHIKGVEVINYKDQKVDQTLRNMFPEYGGPDVAIDAVGVHYAKTMIHTVEQKLMLETDPADTINELIRCVRKGGMISVVGAYAAYTNHFNLGGFMEKGLTIRGGQTPCQRYWPTLMEKVMSGALDPTFVITHRLPLEDAPRAYKIFNNKEDGCIKVVLKPGMRGAGAPAGPA